MRILLITHTYNAHTQRWHDGLLEHGHQVRVLVREGGRPVGVTSPPRAIQRIGPLRKAAVLAQFLATLRAFRPDIIHQHWFELNHCIQLLPETSNLVISVWGSDIVKPWAAKELARARQYAQRAGAVLASSNFLAARTEETLACPVETIHWGVDVTQFAPRSHAPGRFTVGFLKHLAPIYGPDLALEAFARLLAQVPDAELRLYGDGPMHSELAARVDALQITPAVRFMGSIPFSAVADEIAEMDVMIMPSRMESLGMAALEAQAMGVPVVAARVGGVPEAVHDGVGGLLTPPEDPGALADALLLLARDPVERVRLGHQGAAFVRENFDWNTTLDAVAAVYRRIQAKEPLGGHSC